ncbi:hypothetical protein L202_04877 [Cryptococcus amylolentus CBS 6039]|uniref:1-phosphatidylinositol 4-kinase n=1 Tax=Cryptococcus amylolentus CBS 6039 TaxID=1295533 RepID=A0A1E3HN21_9TREE|nr:hypothetical protein L202_04877 [Cryptococcus amylolentus CBS 6039]ODN77738.1 hypothetical protein L202_04877 [Cryptococcus amylolentus CBS 6039]
MSHALLLRLFLSPFFSISIAMQYLKTYPDNIGISHYLCWRMKRMPPDEVEFYWPQICHLLLTYPTSSNALESFIIQRAEESTHSAMLTFWFMQAALRDLTPTRQANPIPFAICQRILHRCHSIIFGDPPEPSRSPYRSLPQASSALALGQAPSGSGNLSDSSARKGAEHGRVNPHIPAALVGMGVVLAGTPGMPAMVDLVGDWAVTQGRRPIDDSTGGRNRVEVDTEGGVDVQPDKLGRRIQIKEKEDSDGSDEEDSAPEKGQKPKAYDLGYNASTTQLRHPAQTAPDLYSPPRTPEPEPEIVEDKFTARLKRKGSDPFGQMQPQQSPGSSDTPPKSAHQPFYSVPELLVSRSPNGGVNGRYSGDRPPSAEAILAAYDLEAQKQLLRSHYCRSEVRFLLLLEDISNRLLVIPKPARVSALRAELTSLNHNLPAEVCMPLWCTADHSHEQEAPSNSSQKPRTFRERISGKGHSRVVRISPGDSVVLNSAERAPYLLHVEILEGDLDFDPTKRENRELLKKIVVQEDMKRRKKAGLGGGKDVYGLGHGLKGTIHGQDGFGSLMPSSIPAEPPSPNPAPQQPKSKPPISPSTPSRNVNVAEVEEVDLVEQMYGAKLSVHDELPDLTETIPLPSGPKNKQLDLQAWERGSPVSTPGVGGGYNYGSASAIGSPSPQPNQVVPSISSPIPAGPSGPSAPSTPGSLPTTTVGPPQSPKKAISLEDYSERMRTAAVMLAQLNASLIEASVENQGSSSSWIPGTGWISRKDKSQLPPDGSGANGKEPAPGSTGGKLKLAAIQAAAIKQRIMEEMMALEEERVERMTDRPQGVEITEGGDQGGNGSGGTAEDEGIVRRELNKADPSAAVFKESWTAKKSRIRAASPWGHLVNWDVISVIVKTGADLRQEQLATQLIKQFARIWKEENCECWARFFRILITGETSGLVETVTDAVSVHSIKRGEYAKRVAEGGAIGHVSLMDYYVNTYGKPDSGRFARAQRNFIRSLAGYSIITYLLQIKDRHNGNILVDQDGHLIHIDFGFMLSNSPGNMGFEAAPFKMPLEYVDIMGGLDSPGYAYFRKLFKQGFEAARKHSDSLITIVELMQRNSRLDCFVLFGEQTSAHFRERFQLGLTTQAVDAYMDRLIVSSTGSNYTRLYDTFQYYSQGVL